MHCAAHHKRGAVNAWNLAVPVSEAAPGRCGSGLRPSASPSEIDRGLEVDLRAEIKDLRLRPEALESLVSKVLCSR